jgi:hypothetical protein
MYSKSWTGDVDVVMTEVEIKIIEVGTTLGVTVVAITWGPVQSGESSFTMAHKTLCLCKSTNGKHIRKIRNSRAILILKVTSTGRLFFLEN